MKKNLFFAALLTGFLCFSLITYRQYIYADRDIDSINVNNIYKVYTFKIDGKGNTLLVKVPSERGKKRLEMSRKLDTDDFKTAAYSNDRIISSAVKLSNPRKISADFSNETDNPQKAEILFQTDLIKEENTLPLKSVPEEFSPKGYKNKKKLHERKINIEIPPHSTVSVYASQKYCEIKSSTVNFQELGGGNSYNTEKTSIYPLYGSSSVYYYLVKNDL